MEWEQCDKGSETVSMQHCLSEGHSLAGPVEQGFKQHWGGRRVGVESPETKATTEAASLFPGE